MVENTDSLYVRYNGFTESVEGRTYSILVMKDAPLSSLREALGTYLPDCEHNIHKISLTRIAEQQDGWVLYFAHER